MLWPSGPAHWIEDRTLFVSVPFTWNLKGLARAFLQRDMAYDRIVIGGPATFLMPNFFDGMDHVTVQRSMPGVLQRVNPLATRTTEGCPNACTFCGVPLIEPVWRELPDWPDLPVICDNNLLAASERHFDRVMDRLERWKWCDFNQGLDCRLLTTHHAERIGRIKGAIARLALDSVGLIDQWTTAAELLRHHGTARYRIRTYVLCGFNDGPESAWKRCMAVEAWGGKPCPQWFHALNALKQNEVTEDQAAMGWTKKERTRIMRRFYKHTDEKKEGGEG
jgi:hypothetical protein